MEEKKWYQSRTIIGALITGIATLLTVTGVVNIDLTEQTTLVDGFVAVGGIVGVIMAIIGRVKAKTAIK